LSNVIDDVAVFDIWSNSCPIILAQFFFQTIVKKPV